MKAYDLIQTTVLVLVLLAALAYAWRKVLPGPSGRVLARWSTAWSRPGRAGWQRRLAGWLKPAQAGGGCDSGCSTCDGCAPKTEPGSRPEAVPLTFRRDPRRP